MRERERERERERGERRDRERQREMERWRDGEMQKNNPKDRETVRIKGALNALPWGATASVWAGPKARPNRSDRQ